MYPNEVVCTPEVQAQRVEKKGVPMLNCDSIEGTLIDAWPQASGVFGCKEKD